MKSEVATVEAVPSIAEDIEKSEVRLENSLSHVIDPERERKLVRKLDLWLLPVLTLAYISCFVDRASVGNARIMGMAKELNLIGYRFNIALTAFYIPYALVEIPANIVLKRVGPKYWIPFLVFGFGVVSIFSSLIVNFQGLVVVRVFLGVFEGGTMPGIAYTLSCFYRRRELLFRIGIFVSGASLSGAIGGLLATGLSSIPPAGRMHTWRWIFLIEGIFTVLIAILTFFVIPYSPDCASFLNDEERELAAARIEEELKHIKNEPVDWKQIKRALTNKFNLMCGLGFFFDNMIVQSFSLFLPTILNDMGFVAIKSQLLTVPPYLLACAFAITVAYMSDRMKRRGVWIIFPFTLVIIGFAILIGTTNTAAKYFAIFLSAMGAFPAGPGFLAWGTNNVASHTARAVSSGMIVSIGTLGAIVSTWVYLPQDSPTFHKGHAINLGAGSAGLLLCACMIVYIRWENGKRAKGERDHRLDGFTSEEEASQLLGDKHPSFRYIE